MRPAWKHIMMDIVRLTQSTHLHTNAARLYRIVSTKSSKLTFNDVKSNPRKHPVDRSDLIVVAARISRARVMQNLRFGELALCRRASFRWINRWINHCGEIDQTPHRHPSYTTDCHPIESGLQDKKWGYSYDDDIA